MLKPTRVLLFVAHALWLGIAFAERQTTSAIFSGPIQTVNVPTATGQGVIEVHVSAENTSVELPKPFGSPEPKLVEYRFLAILALLAVISTCFLGWSRWRKSRPGWLECPCWRCRLLVLHFCRPFHLHCCDKCQNCRAYVPVPSGPIPPASK
ncbi:hypothetical protein QBC44DRAFT_329100 [Cladorrhinum sp. PSN332]|nr:hypothetical protein QBC44DRAFT_329100 [Cladorrhinum sp. PSN332]